MPRKAKITAVPVDAQPDQTLEQVAQDEPKTEAEQMTDVINEVNVSESTMSNEDEAPAVQAEVVTPKQEPEQKGQDPKVACPDCGKKMAAKTLKYSHGPNCVINKQKQSQDDEEYAELSHKAKQLAQEVGGESGAHALHAIGMLDSLGANALMQHHMQTRARAERATRREAMVANLMKNAF